MFLKRICVVSLCVLLTALCSFGFMVTVTGCQSPTDSSDQGDTDTDNKTETIYVIGRVNSGGGTYSAVYWLNETCYRLSTSDVSSSGSFANSVAVLDDDIYICGHYYQTSLEHYVPCYWKNGVLFALSANFFGNTIGKNNAYANSIAVDGSDFHIVGHYYSSSGSPYMTYGKNSLYTNRQTVSSQANSVAVSSSDVYIAGNYHNGTSYVPCYWKNGTITELSTLNSANSIAIDGSDVYIAGTCLHETDSVACIWKNGEITKLSTKPSSVSSIKIEGTDVYCAGTYYDGSIHIACYWKNGNITDLSTFNSTAHDITVNGTDVYVTGSYDYENNSHFSVACYWKNGEITELTSTSSDAYAQSLLVLLN